MSTLPLLPYTFRSPKLLQTALTVPAPNLRVQDNQRLEFLGDAVLGLLAAERLYARHPSLDEGGLTEYRTALVSGEALFLRAERLAIAERLTEQNGRAQWQAKEIVDAIEALFGAAWLDGGKPAVELLFQALYTEADIAAQPIVKSKLGWRNRCRNRHANIAVQSVANPKGELLTLAQNNYTTLPVYTLLEQSGPMHAPSFRCAASLGDWTAEGTASTRKKAEAEAARNLLLLLNSQT